MANEQTTTTRPRKTLDEKIGLENARFENLNERIAKLGTPIDEVKKAELALVQAKLTRSSAKIAALVASKDAPEIPAELKSDINSIKKAIKVATKHNAPAEYITTFAQLLKGLEGMAAPQEQASA